MFKLQIAVPHSYVTNKVDNDFFFYPLPLTYIQEHARAFQRHRDTSATTPHLNSFSCSFCLKHCDLAQKNASGSCKTVFAHTDLSVTVSVKRSITSSVVKSFLYYVPTLLKHLSISERRCAVSLKVFTL